MAQRAPPPNCVALLPGGDVPPVDVTYYNCPGGPIIVGKSHANRYIAFIFANTDAGHRVAYHEMTGMEQWEWHDAWIRCNRTHIRVEQETRGLCGTDLTCVQNAVQLREALLRSPSSAHRRPANHVIGQGVWNNTVRQLFP